MAALFSEGEIKQALDGGAEQRGRAYQLAGRLRQLTVSDDGTTISSSMQGNRSKPYSQVIGLKRRTNGLLDANGYCSCPMGRNCKHVAAVLLEHVARSDGAPADVRSLPLGDAVTTGRAASASSSPTPAAQPPTATLSGPVAK